MAIAGQGDKWLRNYVPYIMYRITNTLNRRLRRQLREVDINVARWRVLGVLRAYGKLNLGRIVELTVMEQPSVSRIVTQLESERLVRRKVSEKDSRFVFVSLTAAGERAFENIYPTAERHQWRALQGFTRSEVRTLIQMLRRIQHNIETED